MYDPTHLDLFTGLGGFSVAAGWAGFRTVGMCESDERCRGFLERAHGLRPHPDIKTFDGSRYRGVTLLTGGPPCQPSSRAGQQRGKSDDRWLWNETLRVLDEAEPDGCLLETPVGIEDLDFDGILFEMERIGYEVQTFDIPACAVDSPQIRRRYWIVGFMADDRRAGRHPWSRAKQGQQDEHRGDSNGCGGGLADAAIAGHQGYERRSVGDEPERRQEQDRPAPPRAQDVADTGCERCGQDEPERGANGRNALGGAGSWSSFVWVPCEDGYLRRAPDESVDVVNGLHRSVLAALGNSIVPQVAYEIILNMKPFLCQPAT